MNREIEFRGKRKDTGEWVFGDLVYNFKHESMIEQRGEPGIYLVDPETVGQYTGLRDKNGAKVFEGDIVELTNDIPDETYRGIITFDDLEWAIDAGDDLESLYNQVIHCEKTIEVIGNAHDNPELFKWH